MRSQPDVIAAYAHTSHHRREIMASEVCGCFYCGKIFPPSEIEMWLNEADGTAMCPYCAIDSVIGSASGLPITDTFLWAMHAHWFGGRREEWRVDGG